MSENVTTLQTQHAMLVVWGEYAQSIGLVKGIESVPLEQKTVDHSPCSSFWWRFWAGCPT
ncbi:MAG: hypothetical protein ACOYZ7_03345 [Chloroflexota bacterium]